jgi:DNA-binding response OmpR family regulator
MRILIVEDEWMIADDLAAALTRGGCTVAGIAGNLGKGLKLASELAFDAAVLDANLDGTSAQPIAAVLQGRGIPFLVVSGYASDQRTGALAAAPFLSKPYDAAELVTRVRSLLPSG